MSKDLTNYRKSYEKKQLDEASLPQDPMLLFTDWFKEVEETEGVEEVNAMTLTTQGDDGFPKSRVVLLKQYNEKGFTFFTNYNSEKGTAIANNNKVCLSFFWPNLERQVIIKGIAQKIKVHDSQAYFKSRPRGSQLGAWASNQSQIISSRADLEEKLRSLEQEYKDKEIPKPSFWGGYLVSPVCFEFWQGRPNRFHDRIRFLRSSLDMKSWAIDRLEP